MWQLVRKAQRMKRAAMNTWVEFMQRTRYEEQNEDMEQLVERTRNMLGKPLGLVIRGRRDAEMERITVRRHTERASQEHRARAAYLYAIP